MTREHFEAFAKMLRETPNAHERRAIAAKIIPVFKQFNPLFHERKFREAAKCEEMKGLRYALSGVN